MFALPAVEETDLSAGATPVDRWLRRIRSLLPSGRREPEQAVAAPGPPPVAGPQPEAAPGAQVESADDTLSIYNLQKSYKGRRVIEDVSLYLRRGEVVGLLGPNGAGKTTLFYMITGLIRPAGRGPAG